MAWPFARHGAAILVGLILLSPLESVGANEPAAARVPATSWQLWSEAARRELEIPGAEQLPTARNRALEALQLLESQLVDLPNGVILQRQWGLGSLREAFDDAAPPVDVLQRAEQLLHARGPQELQPRVNELRRRVIMAGELAALQSVPDAKQRLQADIERLAEYAAALEQAPTRNLSAEVEDSYARLVRLGVVPKRLEEVRQAISYPNEIVRVRADFVAEASRRTFHIPLSFAQSQDDTTIWGNGRASATAAAALIPNQDRGELRVEVNGGGHLWLQATRNRASLTATANLGMNASQSLFLGPEGVAGNRPQIGLANDLTLESVALNLRSALIRNLLTRLASRIAPRLLDAQEGQIATQGAQTMEDRIAEEGYDIAYRVNGLFQRAYWLQLAAGDIQPRFSLRSTATALEGHIEHGHPWQLAAPRYPPALHAPDADIEVFVHESAINHGVDTLAGRWLDEATYRELAIEEFKLASRDEQPGPGRVPAAIRLADHNPLQLSVGDNRITVIVRISACRLDRQLIELPVTTLRVAYSIRRTPSGFDLIRDELRVEPEGDEHANALAEVLQRYFPERASNAPRFQNASFKQFMGIREVLIRDGWIGIGMQHREADEQPSATPAP